MLENIDDLVRQLMNLLTTQVDGDAGFQLVAHTAGLSGLTLIFLDGIVHSLSSQRNDLVRRDGGNCCRQRRVCRAARGRVVVLLGYRRRRGHGCRWSRGDSSYSLSRRADRIASDGGRRRGDSGSSHSIQCDTHRGKELAKPRQQPLRLVVRRLYGYIIRESRMGSLIRKEGGLMKSFKTRRPNIVVVLTQ